MEKSEADVRQFLARFLPKLKTWGIIYLNRDKNKVAIGEPSSKTICISFHLAEYPLKYAFK